MGIVKDAINDILPKKKDKMPEKSDIEKLQEMKEHIAELEKTIVKDNSQTAVQQPQELPLDSKLQVLEHNILAVLNEFDDRVRAIEQFLIRNYDINKEKK